MNPLHPHTTGLALGALFAFFHLVWLLLVAAGLAQSVLDVVFRLHLLVPVMQVAPFSWGLAVGLLALTFAVGYVLGIVFAFVWNAVR